MRTRFLSQYDKVRFISAYSKLLLIANVSEELKSEIINALSNDLNDLKTSLLISGAIQIADNYDEAAKLIHKRLVDNNFEKW